MPQGAAATLFLIGTDHVICKAAQHCNVLYCIAGSNTAAWERVQETSGVPNTKFQSYTIRGHHYAEEASSLLISRLDEPETGPDSGVCV